MNGVWLISRRRSAYVVCIATQQHITGKTIDMEIQEEIQDSLDSRLDLALDLTFPASDPISVYIPDRDDNNGITEPKPAAVTPDE